MKKILNIIFWMIFVLNAARVFAIALFELAIATGIYIVGKIIRHKEVAMYGRNIALAMDQWASTQLLGHPDETISSRLGRSIKDERYWWVKPFRIIVDVFARYVFFEKDHCAISVSEIEQLKMRTDKDQEIWRWNRTKVKLRNADQSIKYELIDKK